MQCRDRALTAAAAAGAQPCIAPHAFIATTLQRLVAAQEMNDLWQRDDPQQHLWRALREAGLLV